MDRSNGSILVCGRAGVSPSGYAPSWASQAFAAYQSNGHDCLSNFSSYLNDLWIIPRRSVEKMQLERLFKTLVPICSEVPCQLDFSKVYLWPV